jgi:hypothetical protein
MNNLYRAFPLIISAAALAACTSEEGNQALNQVAEASVEPSENAAAAVPVTSNLSAPADVSAAPPSDPAPQTSGAPSTAEPRVEPLEKSTAPTKPAPKSTPKSGEAPADTKPAKEPPAETNTTAATCTPEHRAMGHC